MEKDNEKEKEKIINERKGWLGGGGGERERSFIDHQEVTELLLYNALLGNTASGRTGYSI